MVKFLVLPALMVFALNANAAGSVKIGDAAPCVDLNHLTPGGTELKRSTCAAEKANQNLVLTFFATWCHYCVADLPVFTKLAEKYHGQHDFRLVGVDKEKDMRAFFATKDHSKYDIAFDPKLTTVDAFDLEGTPTLIVIGPDQKVKYIYVGEIDPKDLPEVEKAIAN